MHRFDIGRLERYLADHIDGFRPPMTVRQFEGGQSNPTFLLEAGAKQWVLRKKPPGQLLPSAHQVEREHRVMSALQDSGVPVPKMLHACNDTSVMGTEFFVMQMVAGRVIVDALVSELEPDHRRALYMDFADILGRLHSVDYEAVGLGEGFGRPGNYFARQIARWSRQYEASKTDDIPEIDALIAWLPDNIPDDDTTSIVHGDYSIKNCIVHPTEPRILAVLDWELSTIGHPFGDLAYICHLYHGEHSKDELSELGVPSRDELVAQYCKASGRPAIEDWSFYMAYSMFRSAAIVQGVVKRGLDGTSASENSLTYKPQILASARRGWGFMQERLT